MTPADYKLYAAHEAEVVGIDGERFVTTLNKESGFDPNSAGDKGTSIGCAEIHLVAHPDVTRENALDCIWAINWAAHQFKIGNAHIWTEYRLLYGDTST